MKSVDSVNLEDADGYIKLNAHNRMELVKLFIEWLECEGAEVAWVQHNGTEMTFSVGPDPRQR